MADKSDKDQETLSVHSSSSKNESSIVSTDGASTTAEDSALTTTLSISNQQNHSPDLHRNGVDNAAFDMSDDSESKKSDNLELVELNKAANAASIDKNVDIEKGEKKTADSGPFGEQYISINEHKKGLRGEKLYVTKDTQRERRSGSTRCCWATLGAFILIGIIVVAVLVGMGIIDPQPNKSLESLKDHHHHHNHNHSGPRTSGVFHVDAPETTLSPLTTTLAPTVPNAFDGKFRITNRVWQDALNDKSSEEFQSLSNELQEALSELFPGAKISVQNFQSGSVIVKFRITLPNGQVVSHKEVTTKLKDFMNRSFEIDSESIEAQPVTDMCSKMNCNGGECIYMDNSFKCKCSDNMRYDETSLTCINDDAEALTEQFDITNTTVFINRQGVVLQDEDNVEDVVTEKLDEAQPIAEPETVDKDLDKETITEKYEEAESEAEAEHSEYEDITKTSVENKTSSATEKSEMLITEMMDEMNKTSVESFNSEAVSEKEINSETTTNIYPDIVIETTTQMKIDSMEMETTTKTISEDDSIMKEMEEKINSEMSLDKINAMKEIIEHQNATEMKSENDSTMEEVMENETVTEMKSDNETTEKSVKTTTEMKIEDDSMEESTTEKKVNIESMDKEAETTPKNYSEEESMEHKITTEMTLDHDSMKENVMTEATTTEMKFEADSTEQDTATKMNSEKEFMDKETTTAKVIEITEVLKDPEMKSNMSEVQDMSENISFVEKEIISEATTFEPKPSVIEEPSKEMQTSPKLEDEKENAVDFKIPVQEGDNIDTQMIEQSLKDLLLNVTKEYNETLAASDEETTLKSMEESTTKMEIEITNAMDDNDKVNDQLTISTTAPDTIDEISTTKSIVEMTTSQLKEDSTTFKPDIIETTDNSFTKTESYVEETTTLIAENIETITELKSSSTTPEPSTPTTTTSTPEATTAKVSPTSSTTMEPTTTIFDDIPESRTIGASSNSISTTNEPSTTSTSEPTTVTTSTSESTTVTTSTTTSTSESTTITTSKATTSTTEETTSSSTTIATTSETTTTTTTLTTSKASSTTTSNESLEDRNSNAVPRKLNVNKSLLNSIQLIGDEEELKSIECKENEFKCGSNECIPRSNRCDEILNCKDGSDEESCETNECSSSEFQCSNGRCIDYERKCDKKDDCPNGEDEEDCEFDCEPGFFLCNEGRCLPNTLRCDGIPHCANGNDEIGCPCQKDEFKCKIGGGCVKNNQLCDGVFDCPDMSDEWGCLKTEENNRLMALSGSNDWIPVCAKHWNSKWSSAACRQMGFDGVESTGIVSLTESTMAHLIDNSFKPGKSYVQAALSNSDNNCDSAITLNCRSSECGQYELSEKIINQLFTNSEVNDINIWPSVAYLYNIKEKKSCTVTVIHSHWVIASHRCISDIDSKHENWAAFAGPASSSDGLAGLNKGTQISTIQRIFFHPSARYSQGFYSNDIALIELDNGFQMDSLVESVCLAEKEMSSTGNDKMCIIAGWTKVGKGVSFNQYLEHISEPNFDTNQCNSTEHYNGHLSSDVFCSEDISKKCKEDYGAPLMCKDKNSKSWELQGILSHEGECKVGRKHPDIFTSITDHLDWINSVMGRE